MRAPAVVPAVVLAAALAAGCSLPLPSDVHAVGPAPAEQHAPPALQVIPPGPKAGATPVETVLGFLGAQASSEGGHAVARQFLRADERLRWRDEGVDVLVYDPDRLRVQPVSVAGDRAVVRVVSVVSARLAADGSYLAQPDTTVTEEYRLSRSGGTWQLVDVPEGLRLTAADRARAFVPEPVYFLVPGAPEDQPHLVPDRVFLPDAGDLPRELVERVLTGPSQQLAGSVATAVPPGTLLRSVGLASSGLLTVDLDTPAPPTGRQAQDLSAQLVWTLRSLGASFRALRLQVRGRPLHVPGEGALQPSGEWGSYDPDRLGPNPPYFFSSGRRLRSSAELPPGPATAGDVGDGRAVAVDAVAVTPDRTRAALLERGPGGTDTVRVGPLRGTSFPVAARGRGLSSPSWGSGDRGVWLVAGGRSVVRVAEGLRPVPVVGLPSGVISSLAVSRDGVRVALVVGGGLYVGRVDLSTGDPRVVGLEQVLPQLRAVTQVAWETSTQLVALGVLTRARQVLRVAVDGSTVQALNSSGLVPSAVAAAPTGVLVLAGSRLYLSSGGGFRQVQSDRAAAPVFPG